MCISTLNEEPIRVSSLKDTKGLEGHYVITPESKWPVYIPRISPNGIPILPEDWYEDYWDEVEPRLN